MAATLDILLEKYKDNTLTAAEWQQLRQLVSSGNYEELIKDDIARELQLSAPDAGWKKTDQDAILAEILATPQQHPGRIHFLKTIWFRYAAAIIILTLTVGGYFWLQRTSHPQIITGTPTLLDISPGSSGAILTLADGSQMVLDSMGNGIVATQNGTQLVLKNGLLAYDRMGQVSGNSSYNTMTTPRGRQFQLILPDGSKVWLNAASSIRYPTAFSGAERRVEITGEAYFEIAASVRKPFYVEANGMEVRVLGTSFNINSYANEPAIRTTLIEGKVIVKAGMLKKSPVETLILAPGEQAVLLNDKLFSENPDIEQVVAWKNGLFNFTNADLPMVMRQLERWYDIEVDFEGPVPVYKFQGKMDKGVRLPEVLEMLTKMDLKFKMTGKKLIVTK